MLCRHLPDTGLGTYVSGLATDWLSGTVYWTDNIRHRVDAVTQDGSHVRCMAWQDVDQPRDIVVHPIKR